MLLAVDAQTEEVGALGVELTEEGLSGEWLPTLSEVAYGMSFVASVWQLT